MVFIMDKPERNLLPHLRQSEIIKKLAISRSTFWRLRRDKGFPGGIKISDRTEIWKVEDIENWLSSR
jgi:predicted DNA-binding transcriptional regulator AlpA